MTEDELRAIEVRANAATPGPWHLAICCDAIDGRERDDLANVEAGAKDIAYEVPNDDAAFIAAARTDVPALVAEVRRLQALLRATKQIGEVSRPVGAGGEVRIVVTSEPTVDITEDERMELVNAIACALVHCSNRQQIRTMT